MRGEISAPGTSNCGNVLTPHGATGFDLSVATGQLVALQRGNLLRCAGEIPDLLQPSALADSPHTASGAVTIFAFRNVPLEPALSATPTIPVRVVAAAAIARVD